MDVKAELEPWRLICKTIVKKNLQLSVTSICSLSYGLAQEVCLDKDLGGADVVIVANPSVSSIYQTTHITELCYGRRTESKGSRYLISAPTIPPPLKVQYVRLVSPLH